MSDEEVQERPTLPPIRLLFGEELALPAHPPVASTLPNLRADLPSHPTQLPRRDDDSRASRPPPTFRHSSGLELHSGFSTLRSSFVTPTHASMAPGTESSLSRRFSASGHILRVAEPISRARSWSDTMIASPPYPGHAAMKGLPDNYRTASPRTSPRNTPRVHHQALNPYPPDYPVVGGQSLPPPQIGSPGELPNTFAPKYDCPYCGKSFARPSSLKIHINSHTGERPFVCPSEGCGKTFGVLSNMRRHARTAHRFVDPATSDEGSFSRRSHEELAMTHQAGPSTSAQGHTGPDAAADEPSVMEE